MSWSRRASSVRPKSEGSDRTVFVAPKTAEQTVQGYTSRRASRTQLEVRQVLLPASVFGFGGCLPAVCSGRTSLCVPKTAKQRVREPSTYQALSYLVVSPARSVQITWRTSAERSFSLSFGCALRSSFDGENDSCSVVKARDATLDSSRPKSSSLYARWAMA
ncbi:hypothetical protein BAUCODRAFT_34903 [Baudoinia panamericana UAMH 10762]|uniref:Uncharacterized protein n=1 Tax=Baudoinia panamericana (strain UAMH 10762) TaxID=717646 RepID=M2LP28_BAUPA|nr:uncharacterized protein BAUCODRAFT_34903 [Baudoinia panamericana UAMH 10762]EMC96127.1 hypothetical protein BAUCODRAFT_34903 [Baudoinia panamericana UAMH 10762]